MAVADVVKSVHYYVENFGFEIAMIVNDDKSFIGDKVEEGKSYVWENGGTIYSSPVWWSQ